MEAIKDVQQLKKMHDYYATTVMILSQRVQFYAEEFQGVTELLNFYKSLCEELKKQIEALEPKDEEKKEDGNGETTGAAI